MRWCRLGGRPLCSWLLAALPTPVTAWFCSLAGGVRFPSTLHKLPCVTLMCGHGGEKLLGPCCRLFPVPGVPPPPPHSHAHILPLTNFTVHEDPKCGPWSHLPWTLLSTCLPSGGCLLVPGRLARSVGSRGAGGLGCQPAGTHCPFPWCLAQCRRCH